MRVVNRVVGFLERLFRVRRSTRGAQRMRSGVARGSGESHLERTGTVLAIAVASFSFSKRVFPFSFWWKVVSRGQ